MTRINEWHPWKRESHFKLAEPSITVDVNGIHLNAALSNIVNLTQFRNVSLEYNHPDISKADKVRFVLNNEEESDHNFKLTRGRTIRHRFFVSCRDLIRSQPRLNAISQRTRSGKRLYAKQYNRDVNSFYVDLNPCFELSVEKADDIPSDVKGIYRYLHAGEIVYIGRGRIRKRCKSTERRSWTYDKIEYAHIEAEQSQIFWEDKFLNDFKADNNRLPRYNEVSGAATNKETGVIRVI